jgi:hypothetical protein
MDVDLGGSGALPLAERDPRRIGPFPVVGVLGSGGMGRVYLGVAAQGRYAAVKQALPALAGDEGFLRRFGRELDALEGLPAGSGAALLDSDRDARPPWFATAYIPGLTLTEALRAHGGPLPVPALWALLREAAAGLADLHARDMAHRDLKPSNVMLTLDGVTLIDVGVSRAADRSRPARTGVAIDAPAYLAPEQAPEQASAQGEPTGAADVFALAAVLSYAAIGAPPFGEGAGPDVLHRIVHDEPELGPVRAVDADLAGVLASCLDKDPTARPTAAELSGLAGTHAAAGSGAAGLWPASVRERIALRAGFATSAPDPAAVGGAGGTPQDPPRDAPDAGRRPERRRKLLLLALPVLVACGAALAVLLAPDSGSAQGSAAPGASVAAPAGPSASAPQSPPGTPSPAPSSDGAASPAPDGSAYEGGTGGTGGTPHASGGATGTSPSSAGTGGATGAGAVPPPAAPGPPTGTGQLRNSADSQCLTDLSLLATHTPQVGPCGSKGSLGGTLTYSWTFAAASGGTFRLVDQAGDACLTAASRGGSTGLSACDDSPGQQWRIGTATGTGSTYQSVSNGQCLVVASLRSVATGACDSTQAAQVWYRP